MPTGTKTPTAESKRAALAARKAQIAATANGTRPTRTDADRAADVLKGVGRPTGPARGSRTPTVVRNLDGTPATPEMAAKVKAPAPKPAPAKAGTKAPVKAKAPAPAAPVAKAATSAEGKRELATRVILAIGEMVKGLTAAELKEMGFDRPGAAMTASSWVHHLPADRARWVKVLPAPNRSNWK